MKLPVALTIAGSDSGGGAGIQADLKTFAMLGVHGTSAITAITAQNTTGVTDILELPVRLIREQIKVVAEDIGVDAAKTGMLSSPEIIAAVAAALAEYSIDKLVVDPVMVAKGGAKLLRDDAVSALREHLIPLATVITPNLHEAIALVGDLGSRAELAAALHRLGARAVIVTGGHGEESIDHLFDGERHVEIAVKRHEVAATHGAGCTHSATLAANLAKGLSLVKGAENAARAASEAVRNGLVEIGAGEGPVDVLA